MSWISLLDFSGFRRSGCLSFKREPIARCIGIGLLVGLTPTVGLQTVVMPAGCLLVRGNFPAASANPE